jgi:hypothetical protein
MRSVFGTEATNKFVNSAVSGFAAGTTVAMFNGGKYNVTQVAADAFGNALGNSLAAASSQSRDPWKELDNLGRELATSERFAAYSPTTNPTDFAGSDAQPKRTDATNLDGTPISPIVVAGHKMSLWEKVEAYVDDAGNAIANLFSSSNGSSGSGLSPDQVRAIVAAGQDPDAVGNDFRADPVSDYRPPLNPDDWAPTPEKQTSILDIAQENKRIIDGLSDANGWRSIYKATNNFLANSSIGGPNTTPLTANERAAAFNTAKSALGFLGKETEPMLMFALPDASVGTGIITRNSATPVASSAAGVDAATAARYVNGEFHPSDFGLNSIADDPQLHDLWTNAQKSAQSWNGRPNAYQRLLASIENGATLTGDELSNAFSTVRGYYNRAAELRGVDLLNGDIHHWNFNKAEYPDQVFDPRNLFPTKDDIQHSTVHYFVGSGNGFSYAKPTLPNSVLRFDSSYYPLPTRYFDRGVK